MSNLLKFHVCSDSGLKFSISRVFWSGKNINSLVFVFQFEKLISTVLFNLITFGNPTDWAKFFQQNDFISKGKLQISFERNLQFSIVKLKAS